jgi:hypothetical protein
VGASMSRKDAIRAYKERKPSRGAFAVRCTATGQVWVGSSPNLDAARNGIWFGLNLGSYLDKTLQAEWNAHGEQAFEYEILEKLDDDAIALELKDLLKERKRLWADRLGARTLL